MAIRGGLSRNTRVKPEAPPLRDAVLNAPGTVKAVVTTSAGVAVTTTTVNGKVALATDDETVRRLLVELNMNMRELMKRLAPSEG